MIETRLAYASFAFLGSLFFSACGGQPITPVPEPTGPDSAFYALHVDTSSDECSPARATGDLGEFLVLVDASGGNIPIVSSAGQSGPPRQDIPLSGSTTLDWKIEACPDTAGHVSVGPVTASKTKIVIPWKENWQGLADCQPPAGFPTSDCVSDRVLTFTWVRPVPTE